VRSRGRAGSLLAERSRLSLSSTVFPPASHRTGFIKYCASIRVIRGVRRGGQRLYHRGHRGSQGKPGTYKCRSVCRTALAASDRTDPPTRPNQRPQSR
jgi:hypothetical protein